MRCFLFSIGCLLLMRCASDYKGLQATAPDDACAARIVPARVNTSWYNADVDVVGRHISGLLLVKHMPDSSYRVVFTNEAGVTFFDFGFLTDGDFKVYNAIHQLNKKAVIQTLRKDFELVLGLPFRQGVYQRWTEGEEVFFGVRQKKETAYFITSKDCASLRRLEWGAPRKRKVTVQLPGSPYPSPDMLELKHHTFNMQIKLARITKE